MSRSDYYTFDVFGFSPICFRVPDKTAENLRNSSTWNERFEEELTYLIKDVRYSNVSQIWRKVAGRTPDGIWHSLLNCDIYEYDSPYYWENSLAKLILDRLFSFNVDVRVMGDSLFLRFVNPYASTFKETCDKNADIFNDEDNFVEVEACVRDRKKSMFYTFSFGMHTSVGSMDEFVKMLRSTDFFLTRESLESVFCPGRKFSPNILNGVGVGRSRSGMLEGIELYSHFLDTKTMKYSLSTLEIPLRDEADFASFKKSIFDFRVIGGGNDDNFCLPELG